MSEALTDRTLEILELETGAMGCISPERHQHRWFQKIRYLEGKITAAQSPEEKIVLEQQLENINRIESKKAELIVDIYNLNSQIEPS